MWHSKYKEKDLKGPKESERNLPFRYENRHFRTVQLRPKQRFRCCRGIPWSKVSKMADKIMGLTRLHKKIFSRQDVAANKKLNKKYYSDCLSLGSISVSDMG